MDPRESLELKKLRLERALDSLLPNRVSALDQAMRYAVLGGGKRFRPLLLITSGKSFGASEDMLLPFACAVELIHSYSLVHDDLPAMDDDDMRRGRPSCHMAFGEGVALLAGDGLLTLAFEVMASAKVPRASLIRKSRAMAEIACLSGWGGMIEGQYLDIADAGPWKEARLEGIILKKTASLIQASAKAGAILAGAGISALKIISDFGMHLGLAFQIRDDLQDIAPAGLRKGRFGPNYAEVLGRKKSREKLREHTEKAFEVLGKGRIKSPELHHLAASLLRIED